MCAIAWVTSEAARRDTASAPCARTSRSLLRSCEATHSAKPRKGTMHATKSAASRQGSVYPRLAASAAAAMPASWS